MVQPSVQTNPPATDQSGSEANREERLRALYTSLLSELEALHKDGKILKTELQTAIDKQKMENILKTIKDS